MRIACKAIPTKTQLGQGRIAPWQILAARLRDADQDAYNEIYRIFFPRLLRFCFSYVRDNAAAENIVQDAFLKLWEVKSTLAGNTNLPAYLTTLVKNASLNYLQKKKSESRVYSSLQQTALSDVELRIQMLQGTIPENIFSKELQVIVKKAIDQLPEQTRRVLLMNRYEEKSYREIAQLLGISEKGVEYHISKAFRELRTLLKDYLFYLFLTLPHFF